MRIRHAFVVGSAITIAATIISIIYWNRVPERMPIHFDIHGAPNGFGSRWVGLGLMPLVMFLLGSLFAVLPRISPEGFKAQGAESAIATIMLVSQSLLLMIHMEAVRAASTNSPLHMTVTTFGLGAFLAVVGNLFGKMRRNFFVGVRTPWTLADPEVWVQTHQFAGKLFMAAGVVTMLASVITPHGFVPLAAILTAAAASYAYSFVLYRRLHSKPS